MSEEKKVWALAVGAVQAFTKNGVKEPAVRQGNANGQPVFNLTIKTFTKGELVDVALWGEFAHVAPQIQDGYILFVDGPVSQREYNGRIYNKIDAKRLGVMPLVVPQEREVVNAVPAQVAAVTTAAPVASAPVAEAAPVVAVAAPFTF